MKRNSRNRKKVLEPCITVRAEHNNSDPERMIRKFRKLVKNEGIIEEYRDRCYYKPPSERRREQKRERQRTIDKVNRKREELIKPRDRFKKRRV